MSNRSESLELGQFIPLHYHHNMLGDTVRMEGFKAAIDLAVAPGSKVLELGGGTGVQSFFAAQRAEHVWCVERNPELVAAAREILSKNPEFERIELVQADAYHYLPPEPVDVVICEMLHTGLLREKQLPIIDSFKRRYLEKFGGPLPTFIPEACLQAIQPVQQDFEFFGFYAPTIAFQDPCAEQPRTRSLADPEVFQLFAYHEPFGQTCSYDGVIEIAEAGELNALRLITKNVLAIDVAAQNTVDWHTQHIVFPLPEPMAVAAGDRLSIRFDYQGGDPLTAFTDSLVVRSLAVDERSRSVA